MVGENFIQGWFYYHDGSEVWIGCNKIQIGCSKVRVNSSAQVHYFKGWHLKAVFKFGPIQIRDLLEEGTFFQKSESDGDLIKKQDLIQLRISLD